MLLGAVDSQMLYYAVLPLIGGFAGLLGGLLGVGGGLIMIPAMLILLGEPFGVGSLHVYKLGALGAATVLSIPAAMQHLKAGAVIKAAVRPMIAGAVVGVVLGASLSTLFAGEYTHILRRVFGVAMLLTVAANIWRSTTGARRNLPPDAGPLPQKSVSYAALVGGPAGVISGLLGVGGGVWAVPLQHYGLGLRLPNAIANSSCMIVAVAGTASVAQAIVLHRMPDLDATKGWALAALLAPGALLGGYVGAAFTHRLPVRLLRYGFDLLLVITGIRLMIGNGAS